MVHDSPCSPAVIGVGIDTARYGHYASFLREDLQPATKPLEFLESHGGYRQLEQMLRQLAEKQPHVHFPIRLDAGGQ